MDEPQLRTRLADAFAALVRGVHHPGSEADAEFEPFHAEFDEAQDVDADSFRAAADVDPQLPLKITPASDWFDAVADGRGEPGDDAALRALERVMVAALSGEVVYVTAQANELPEGLRFIVGRVEGGGLAGLVAPIVWT